jgi:tetratricopeptide (TPR) repeat protein
MRPQLGQVLAAFLPLLAVMDSLSALAQTESARSVALQDVAAQSHYERAVSAEQSGDYELAIRELRAAVQVRPSEERLRTALGVAFFHEGYLANAIAEFSTAIQLQPDQLDARADLAAVWMNLGDAENAIPELEYVVAADAADLSSRSNLGICYLQAGRWDDALREYSTLLKSDPDSPELLYNLAVTQKHQQDYEGARASLQKGLQHKRDFPAAEFELGEIYWEEGMLDEAASHLQALCRAHPDFLPAYFPLAEVLRQKGDLDLALSTIQKVLQAGPSATAYQELAILQKQRGNVDAAALAFHQAEELKNKAKLSLAAQLATATAKRLLRAHDAEGAMRKLEFALRLDPGSAESHFQFALALKQKHDDARALEEFRKAFELDNRLKPPPEQ